LTYDIFLNIIYQVHNTIKLLVICKLQEVRGELIEDPAGENQGTVGVYSFLPRLKFNPPAPVSGALWVTGLAAGPSRFE